MAKPYLKSSNVDKQWFKFQMAFVLSSPESTQLSYIVNIINYFLPVPAVQEILQEHYGDKDKVKQLILKLNEIKKATYYIDTLKNIIKSLEGTYRDNPEKYKQVKDMITVQIPQASSQIPLYYPLVLKTLFLIINNSDLKHTPIPSENILNPEKHRLYFSGAKDKKRQQGTEFMQR